MLLVHLVLTIFLNSPSSDGDDHADNDLADRNDRADHADGDDRAF